MGKKLTWCSTRTATMAAPSCSCYPKLLQVAPSCSRLSRLLPGCSQTAPNLWQAAPRLLPRCPLALGVRKKTRCVAEGLGEVQVVGTARGWR